MSDESNLSFRRLQNAEGKLNESLKEELYFKPSIVSRKVLRRLYHGKWKMLIDIFSLQLRKNIRSMSAISFAFSRLIFKVAERYLKEYI